MQVERCFRGAGQKEKGLLATGFFPTGPETDTETLREWMEHIRRDPTLLKALIKDHFPD
jgi:hypothetical protein